MVLVRLDALSTSELRSIAHSEDIENVDQLSRDELIQALREIYEEENDEYNVEEALSHNTRYLSGITDYREIGESIEQLPGVQSLPAFYPETTSIHLLYKNSDWGYAFWNISKLDREKITEKRLSVFLRVSLRLEGLEQTYDIPITEKDTEWNISLPTKKGKCELSLITEDKEGRRDALAFSEPLELNYSYYLDNKDAIKRNAALLPIYISLIVTREGEMLHTPLVDQVISAFVEENVYE